MAEVDFDALLERGVAAEADRAPGPDGAADDSWLWSAAGLLRAEAEGLHVAAPTARGTAEAIVAELDRLMGEQINLILHHPDFQAVEASWRGLRFLVGSTETGAQVKFRVLDIGKRELARTLRKYRGTAWDQSPIFIKLYEEEYGQLGGEPFGMIVGDYAFDHHPEDVQLLSGLAMIAAAAHAPFIAAASPSVMQMSTWGELANPRDLTRIFSTPEYAAWRAMRSDEDVRYVGLCMPRFLGRLPYGARTDPQDDFVFEEDADGEGIAHISLGECSLRLRCQRRPCLQRCTAGAPASAASIVAASWTA